MFIEKLMLVLFMLAWLVIGWAHLNNTDAELGQTFWEAIWLAMKPLFFIYMFLRITSLAFAR